MFFLQYVLTASEAIKKTAHWEVDVEVDFFHVKSGTNHLVSGLFNGKTLVYSDLHHVVLRIMPKFAPESGENAILVSSHIDTVFSAYVSTYLIIFSFDLEINLVSSEKFSWLLHFELLYKKLKKMGRSVILHMKLQVSIGYFQGRCWRLQFLCSSDAGACTRNLSMGS